MISHGGESPKRQVKEEHTKLEQLLDKNIYVYPTKEPGKDAEGRCMSSCNKACSYRFRMRIKK